MDLDLSEDQVMLKSAAREFLEQESPVGFVRDMEHEERGFTSELWQKLAEVGWLGLPVPEAYGGTGQGLFDLGLLMEEVGQTLLPGPFFNRNKPLFPFIALICKFVQTRRHDLTAAAILFNRLQIPSRVFSRAAIRI